MATVTGDVISLNRADPMFHAVKSHVFVRQGRTVLGSGQVTEDDDFSIEISDDVRGEVEVVLDLLNSAPSLAIADGSDIHVTLLYNNVNNFIV